MLDGAVNVFRVRDNARLPERAHATDAGMDFFFAPVDGVTVRVEPGQTTVLETGVKVQVPDGCMLQIMNKSGVATKRQLITGACVVDEGYDGEIFINLQNIGRDVQYIEPGQKLAQGVFVKILKPELLEINRDSIYGRKTARGDGSLGSTGV